MPINQKIDIFIQFVRRSKKGVFIPLIIATIISVFLILAVVIFILISFHSKLVDNYYKNILYDVYDFQSVLINKNSYRKDIVRLSEHISARNGVKAVWVVDRNGKCIFHSNKSVLEEYMGKNMPTDYYKNINVIWKFGNGYPLIVKNKIKKFGDYRLSIPLYPFGKDYYDFILGIDVSLIPTNIPVIYLLIFIIGFFIISGAILFLPLWYVTNRRFEEISTQAMILGGTLKAQKEENTEENTESPGSAEEVEKPGEKEVKKEFVEEKVKEVKAKKIKGKASTQEEKFEVEEEVTEKKEKIPKPVSQAEKTTINKEADFKEKLEEMEVENPNIRLLELKQSIFRRKKNELSNLEVESFPYHSGTVLGSYVTTLEKGDIIWPIILSYYYSDDIVEGYQIIKKIYDYLGSILKKEGDIKSVCLNLNSFYLENDLKGDFTIIKISGSDVVYTSLGNNYAIYLKGDEKEVKDLDLGLPQLGGKKDNFEELLRTADIKFKSKDIFIAMPSNAKKIRIDDQTMDAVIRNYLLDYRNDYEKMANELNNILKSSFRKDRKMEETGFIGLRFV